MTAADSRIDPRPRAIFLMGPTASGKTALVCALAERFPLQIISVDSALVYRGLDIGAAKPDAKVLRQYPHRLIDIRDPSQPYSAAIFRDDALAAMQDIVAKGDTPLLAGGTGLYFRALQQGLSEMPQADAALRERLHDEAERVGWPALHARLAARDSRTASRINENDAQRIQRALEVIELSGQSLSMLRATSRAKFPYRVLKLALIPRDRDALRLRIARRFDAMLAHGFLDEVRGLRARSDLHVDLPSMRAVGYRQAWAHLDGEYAGNTFRERAIFATNQLAKRQLTWLRGEHDARVFDPLQADPLPAAADALAQFMGAG